MAKEEEKQSWLLKVQLICSSVAQLLASRLTNLNFVYISSLSPQVRIRLQSAGTSVQLSSALAPLWKLALSPGVKAPCRPCRGWRREWGWGRPPQSYKRWPQLPTQTGPSSYHAPWLTEQQPPDSLWSHHTSGMGLRSAAGASAGHFNFTDSPLKMKRMHHMNMLNLFSWHMHTRPVHTHVGVLDHS